jgi:hypothetical protein
VSIYNLMGKPVFVRIAEIVSPGKHFKVGDEKRGGKLERDKP